ncbi:helix-turn-helix transcriptional regulator [Nocardiopsis coralliicola]
MRPPVTPTGFIGRAEELAALLDHARRTRSGPSAALLVGGEAGMGKSRLLAEFLHRLPTRRYAVGGCLELGVEGLPYAPFVAVLRQLLRTSGPELVDAAGGPGELPRLLPELGPVPDDRRDARGLLFQQVLLLLTAAAEDGGLTVVVEDLHWADSATRELLVFLVRSLDGAAVQIIATYRSDALHRDHPLRPLLPELERLPHVDRLDLAPLPEQDAADLAGDVRGRALEPRERALLFERSQGNPLFVESLAEQPHLFDAPVPDRPREMLLSGLQRVSDTAADVVRTASVGAVSADHVSYELLAHVCGLSDGALDAALREAVDANLMHPTETGFRFRHALLREAVHHDLLPGRHTRLHKAFAEALDALPDAVPAHQLAAEQAHHFHAAHDLPRALSASWWAAVYAGRKLASTEQLRMLERALELWDQVPGAAELTEGNDRVALLGLAATAAFEQGAPRRSIELCNEALEVLEGGAGAVDGADPAASGTDERTRRAQLLRLRSQARYDAASAGLDDLFAALELYPKDAPGYALMLSLLARGCMRAPNTDPMEHPAVQQLLAEHRHEESADGPPPGLDPVRTAQHELAHIAVEAARRSGDRPAEADALNSLASALFNENRFAEGRATMERGAELAAEAGDSMLATSIRGSLAHYLREFGRHGEAVELLRAPLDLLERSGLVNGALAFAMSNLAETYWETGDLDACEEWGRRGEALFPSPKIRIYLATSMARTLVERGENERAQRLLGGVEHMGPRRQQPHLQAVQLTLQTSMLLRLHSGTPRDTVAIAVDALRSIDSTPSPGYGWDLLDSAAETLRIASGVPELHDEAADLRECVTTELESLPMRGPVTEARRASALARIAEADGRPAGELAALWDTAIEQWRELPLRLCLTDALLRGAEALAAVGRTDRAACLIRDAAGLAKECGAAVLRNRAEDLARRAGVALDGAAAAPALPAGLTPREADVLRLLGRGATNAEIGAALFISAKTASVHVSNILAKLGAANRGAAAARARELGLAAPSGPASA